MAMLLTSLVATVWAVGYGETRRASPPPQTAIQKAVFMRESIAAARLSANATPALLAHMDSSVSRRYLQSDCPALAAQNSTAILARLLEEMAVRLHDVMEHVVYSCWCRLIAHALSFTPALPCSLLSGARAGNANQRVLISP